MLADDNKNTMPILFIPSFPPESNSFPCRQQSQSKQCLSKHCKFGEILDEFIMHIFWFYLIGWWCSAIGNKPIEDVPRGACFHLSLSPFCWCARTFVYSFGSWDCDRKNLCSQLLGKCLSSDASDWWRETEASDWWREADVIHSFLLVTSHWPKMSF